jgi:hypothetical protein
MLVGVRERSRRAVVAALALVAAAPTDARAQPDPRNLLDDVRRQLDTLAKTLSKTLKHVWMFDSSLGNEFWSIQQTKGNAAPRLKKARSIKIAICSAALGVVLFFFPLNTGNAQDPYDAIRKEEAYRTGIHLGRLDWAKISCVPYGVVRQQYIPLPKPVYSGALAAGRQKGRKEGEEVFVSKHGCYLISELYGWDGSAIRCAWEDRPSYHIGMYGMTAKEVREARASAAKITKLYREKCQK